jgi:Na+-driven multidrug efflux pump
MIYVLRGLLNGSGDAGFAFLNGVVELISRILLARPLVMIPAIGVWGIWWATVITWVISSLSCIWRYKVGKWKQRALTH